MRPWSLALLLTALLGISSPAAAEQIRQFDADITVEANGSLAVHEAITYDFGNQRRHGIFRDIPTKVTTTFGMRDIGMHNFSVQMDGHRTQWQRQHTGGDAGPMVRLKIGDPNRTVSGIHRYDIRYRVAHGVLAASNGRDAVRWNITGTGWPVPILSARAIIHLPTQLSHRDIDSATFSGPYGATGSRATTAWLDDHTFTAAIRLLGIHEGLTVELAYPPRMLGQTAHLEGKAWLAAWLRTYWHWIAFLAGAITMLIVWWRTGRDPRTGPVPVGYDPPKGLDAAQVGLLRDQRVDDVDIGAAVLELARDSYLEIKHKPSEYLGLKPEKITLRRLKVADDSLPEYKQLLLQALFGSYKTLTIGKTISSSRASQMQEDMKQVKELLYAWSAEERLMRENPKKGRRRAMLFGALATAPLLGIALYDTVLRYGPETIFILMFISVFLSFGLLMLIAGKGSARLFGAIWTTISSIIFFGILRESGMILQPSQLLQMPLFSQVLLLGFVLWMGRHMPSRTALGTKVYARILGYREFMQRVDQDKLARHLEEDPLYLDKTLPFAVALGVVDQWVERFESLKVAPPTWYSGNMGDFHHFSSSFAESAGSLGSTSSGGSSGGGGFSGGGGGGGGGGSW